MPEVHEEGGMTRKSTEDFRAVELLCVISRWWIQVVTPLSKPTECTRPRVNSDVRYGFTLRAMMTCGCRVTKCSTCTTLVGLLTRKEERQGRRQEGRKGGKERQKKESWAARILVGVWGEGR